MKVFASILAIAAVASAAATPNLKRRTGIIEMRAASDLCGPLDTPMCCGTDVLGLADLSCSSGIHLPLPSAFAFRFWKGDANVFGFATVPSTVTTSADFGTYCAGEGKSAECCVTSLVSLCFHADDDVVILTFFSAW
ncbi:unnamed protein product [Aureobasidium uvarum]|uniref:Hydrophobin n=1 Tax=Aureobasidium uvarum TaxID=2773716 RepID=A0A9N8KI81_9PEZI|nr:unnamed protein product [Aureobasidium uvarum]